MRLAVLDGQQLEEHDSVVITIRGKQYTVLLVEEPEPEPEPEQPEGEGKVIGEIASSEVFGTVSYSKP